MPNPTQIPVGILPVAFGAIALKGERRGFAWGTAVPCLLFEIFAIGPGTGIELRMKGRSARS